MNYNRRDNSNIQLYERNAHRQLIVVNNKKHSCEQKMPIYTCITQFCFSSKHIGG